MKDDENNFYEPFRNFFKNLQFSQKKKLAVESGAKRR